MHEFESEALAARTARRREGADEARAASPGAVGPDTAAMLHLQRTIGNASVVQMLADEATERSPVHDVVGQGGGAALDSATRSSMERRFGESFGDVRVHTDDRASASAESVGANAYTVGSDIVFRAGNFDPASAVGQRTLAHELSHVVQQRSGPVDGAEAPGGIRLSDPGDRFERAAEATAEQVAGAAPVNASASVSSPTAQLEPDDANPFAPVQREAMEGEEDEMTGL